jgi:hypothetical protein
LADSIRRLLVDGGLRERLSRTGQAATQKYDFSLYAAKLVGDLEEIMSYK